MTTPQGPAGASLPPVQMTTDQLQTLLQQLYQPHPSSQPKIEDPELYYGERAKLRAFLIQCELKFNCEPSKFDKDSKKVNYASARCRGNAWAWIEPSMKEEGVSKYETWKDFKTAISRAFGEADSKEVARRKFKTIKQGNRSAAAYWADFQRLMADLDYNDAMYIDQFHDGLNMEVQRQLALLDERPHNITDYVNKSIALDNRLFNFRTLRTRNDNQYYREFRDTHVSHPRTHESPMSDPTPMELDATRRSRGKDRVEEEKRRRNNECFNCGKTGHFSARCPNKKPYPPRRTYKAAEATMNEEAQEDDSGKEDPQE
jgi:hypothetical protein